MLRLRSLKCASVLCSLSVRCESWRRQRMQSQRAQNQKMHRSTNIPRPPAAAAALTRKALERLLIASNSVGSKLFGGDAQRAATMSAMLQAESLLSQIQGDAAEVSSDTGWYKSLIPQLRKATASMQALVNGLRSSTLNAATQQREELTALCAKPQSCLAAFNLGSDDKISQPPGFTPVSGSSGNTCEATVASKSASWGMGR